MRKSLLIMALGVVYVMNAEYKPGYYNNMDGKSKTALKAAAKQCVERHTVLEYYDLPNYWQYSDVYPELYNGQTRWWEMYSNNIYLIQNGQAPKASFSANKMQREHSVPKSWWKHNGDVEYTAAYSDMWNLYPSDGPANQAKLNYPLGPTRAATYDNGCTKVGPAMTGYGGGSANVFEPADEYKGDFARSFFYMATVYDDLPWAINYMYAQNTYPTLQPWAYQMLLQWARMDPVSQKEIDRNDAVERSQGNRNPFIDFPELAEYIWGTRTEEVFLLDEQGGNVTPPITGDPAITAPVNGEALDIGQAAVGKTVSAALRIEASNLTSSLSVRISGSNREMFSTYLTSIPASQLNKGDYLLYVSYTPTETGNHTARLILYDGGLPDGESIAVTLTGQAFPVPELTAPEALPATDVTETGYTANWTAVTETVDYYVINRVRYTQEGTEGTQLTAAGCSLEIDDRDPEVTETYTVCASRLGCLSEPSNTITVAADAGIGFNNGTVPFAIGVQPGGFMVMSQGDNTGMRVYDITGSLVLTRERVSGGESFTLPAGIYIITCDQAPRPVKIVITY
ncbi:MAG: endonuclease [Muribaculaceae bacterium]|nr:endonuclease [Muribaculaceae bacterium]